MGGRHSHGHGFELLPSTLSTFEIFVLKKPNHEESLILHKTITDVSKIVLCNTDLLARPTLPNLIDANHCTVDDLYFTLDRDPPIPFGPLKAVWCYIHL